MPMQMHAQTHAQNNTRIFIPVAAANTHGYWRNFRTTSVVVIVPVLALALLVVVVVVTTSCQRFLDGQCLPLARGTVCNGMDWTGPDRTGMHELWYSTVPYRTVPYIGRQRQQGMCPIALRRVASRILVISHRIATQRNATSTNHGKGNSPHNTIIVTRHSRSSSQSRTPSNGLRINYHHHRHRHRRRRKANNNNNNNNNNKTNHQANNWNQERKSIFIVATAAAAAATDQRM